MKKKTKTILRFVSIVTLLIFIGNINTMAVQAATITTDSPITVKAEGQTSKPLQPVRVARNPFYKTYGNAPFSLEARAEGQISYQSSDTNILTVSDDGIVTITGAGTAKVIIRTTETENYAATKGTVTVIVDKASQYISVPKDSFYVIYGKKPFSLKAKAETPISYKTSNPKVATVSSKGLVTIKGLGAANITVKAAETNNYKSDTLTVDLHIDLKKPKLKVKRVGRSAVKLSWSKVPGASGYRAVVGIISNVRGDKKNKDVIRFDYKETVKKTSAKKRSASHRNLKRGRSYGYIVQAYRKVGKKTVYGPYSNEKVIYN